MVIKLLDEKLIKGGEKLLRQLDKKSIPVDAAMWFYYPESENWKLILSLSEVVSKGPIAVYKTIQKALDELKDMPFELDDVKAADENDSLLNLIKKAVVTGPGINGIRFSNNTINGQYIQDAYIYRLHRSGNSFAHGISAK